MSTEVKAQNSMALASVKAIYEAAEEANNLLDGMQTAAEEAGTTLDGIYADAEQAKTSAEISWANLSQVQSVLEVAQWIATHGTYVKATTFNPNATYYTLTASQVASPSDDDKDSDGVLIYYELDNGIYVRTTDTSVQAGKTYYNAVGTPVSQPIAEHIADYYTLAVSKAMADYVQSHLALTDDGLYVMKDGSHWKVKITDNGVYILDPDNKPANQMTSDGNIVGYENAARVVITPDSLMAYNNDDINFFGIDYDGGSIITSYRKDFSLINIPSGGSTITIPKPIVAPIYFVSRTRGESCIRLNPKENLFDRIKSSTYVEAYMTASRDRISLKNFSFGPFSGGSAERKTASVEMSRIGIDGTTTVNIIVDYDGDRTIKCIMEAFGTGTSGLELDLGGMVGATAETTAPSFIFGTNTSANNGLFSSTLGEALMAEYSNQLVIGKYNDNQADNAFEIGNGTGENNRSNAFTVSWDGNVEMALDTTATSGTDKEIYDALVDLGWDSDVIV